MDELLNTVQFIHLRNRQFCKLLYLSHGDNNKKKTSRSLSSQTERFFQRSQWRVWQFRSNPCCGIKAGLPFHCQDSTIQSQRSASHCGCQSRQRQQTTNVGSSCVRSSGGVWICAECGGGRSPVPVQEQQQGDARGRGQDGAHPETQLAEVAVLYDGQYGGAAQEHHHLQDEDTRRHM